MIWHAPPIWEGGECFIIGGGPSMPRQFGIPEEIIAQVNAGTISPAAYSPYLAALHTRHVIGINNAYQLGHWLDVIFFGDCGWYLIHRLVLAEWPNLKITCCPRFEKKPIEQSEGIKYLRKDSKHRVGISDNPSAVSWNGNSGAAAISLAAHFGVRRIVLLGMDMTSENKTTHWHQGHGNKKPPPYQRHLRGFPTIAEDAKRRGLEILNASPTSIIQEFPKVEIKEVL